MIPFLYKEKGLIFFLIIYTATPTPKPTSAPAPNPRIRLVDGPNNMEGRAEFWNGTWGTVCDIGFVPRDWPSVFCRELGFGDAENATYVKVRNSFLGLRTFYNFHYHFDIAYNYQRHTSNLWRMKCHICDSQI